LQTSFTQTQEALLPLALEEILLTFLIGFLLIFFTAFFTLSFFIFLAILL